MAINPTREPNDMEIAMREAGIERPSEQGERNAKDLARQAWERHPENIRERRKYLNALFMPQGACWAVVNTNPSIWHQALAWLLELVARERVEAAATDAAGDDPVAEAPGPIETRDPDRGRPGAQPSRYEGNPGTLESFIPIGRLNREAAATARIRSRLDEIMVAGVPLSSTIVSKARQWADMLEQDAKGLRVDATFIRNLCSNLGGNEILGDHYPDPEEINRIYERSEASLADAA